MNNKKITELPSLTTPSLSGVTVVVQNGITYGSTLESMVPLFTGMTAAGSSGTSGTSGSDNALPYSAVEDRKDYTGFLNPNNITVTYDWTGRTITLTSSSIEYYWRGVKYTLSSPWTSSSHDATSGNWYLYSTDGINFNWSQVIWSFTDVMVAAVYYRTTPENTFGIRETHGLMDADSHEEFHRTIGTYLLSGCDVESNSYSGNTPTDEANSPSFFPGIIIDEDLRTTIGRWDENSYTLMYINDTGETSNKNMFIYNSPLPFSATTNTYIQVNNTSTGELTEGEDNRYYNVYQILFPVTSDVASQQHRMVFLQPQTTYMSLAAARAENPKLLRIGSLFTLSAEYLIYTRLTYYTSSEYTNTGKCIIPTGGVSYVSGTRVNQYIESGSTVTITNGGEYRVLTSDAGGDSIIGNPNLMFDGLTLSVSGNTNITGEYLINNQSWAVSLAAASDAYDYTGFVTGSSIEVRYDWTDREITLIADGGINYYWRGTLHTLPSIWTSSAHGTDIGSWFLMSKDGENFIWQRTPWNFSDIMVAYVNYQPTESLSFGAKETHELMDIESHEIFHRQIGTFRLTGGTVTEGTYQYDTNTDSANSPGFNAAIVKDEDLETLIQKWNQGVYTTMFVSGGTSIYNLNSSLPFSGTTLTPIKVNNILTGELIDGNWERYYNIYQILFPATSDVASQKFRSIILQPQSEHSSLQAAKAEDPRTLSFGSLANLAPEFVAYARITYYTNSGYTGTTGSCVIPEGGISYLTGSRANQVSVTDTLIPISIVNAGENRILTSDASGSVANAETKLTFDGITFQLSGTTYHFKIDPDSINIVEGQYDRTVLGPGSLILNNGEIRGDMIYLQNLNGYLFFGGVGSDGSEIWFQTDAYDITVDPHNGPSLVLLDGNGNYATIFGLQSFTGWTDGHITFYRNIWGLSGLTITGNTYVDGDINITGQYLVDGSPISTGSSGTSGTSGTSGSANGILNVIIDGNGNAIPTGITMDVQWAFSANITGWSVMADQQGSIVIDVWEDSFGNFPPTIIDTITGSEKPTLTNQVSNSNMSLSTWTSTLTSGDVWRINVDSITTITRVTVSFYYTRTS